MKRRSKYGNVRTPGGFHSKKEERRFGELALLEMAGKIRGLQTQVRFRIDIQGVHVCYYVADFVYHENGAEVVEDVKGYRTAVYKLKAKLMKAVHGITIKET